MPYTKEKYRVARYERLSREDGDKAESDSIINQQYLLEDFCTRHPEFIVVGDYADDGFTGTNFDRPAFRRMVEDIESGKIDCVIVKDLSRFGRDYIDMGFYLERFFPAKGVRFIAVNDNVDSLKGPYDMLLPLKNVFNAQYAKDISDKVRASFTAKQKRGEFVGAFASYGYLKDPDNHNHLVIDPVASKVVQQIFELTAQGMGQVKVAQLLNDEGIPCPSEYKRLMGQRYTNGNRLSDTVYWTYSTVHKIVRNEMYIGNMVQKKAIRATMHGKAKAAEKQDWVRVENTHEAIISQELWDTVQAVICKNARDIDFSHVGLFAGFLRCGDCGRAMVKTVWDGRVNYSCGSYRRYGFTACTKHYISQNVLEEIILNDLNRVIETVGDLKKAAEAGATITKTSQSVVSEEKRLTAALERVQRLKQNCYEDYQDKLLSRDEFVKYKADYDRQESTLKTQLEQAQKLAAQEEPLQQPWIEKLLEFGHLTELDRKTIAQTVKEIRVFENKHIEITYLFSSELGAVLEKYTKDRKE